MAAGDFRVPREWLVPAPGEVAEEVPLDDSEEAVEVMIECLEAATHTTSRLREIEKRGGRLG